MNRVRSIRRETDRQVDELEQYFLDRMSGERGLSEYECALEPIRDIRDALCFDPVNQFLSGRRGNTGMIRDLLSTTRLTLSNVNPELGISGTFVDTYA